MVSTKRQAMFDARAEAHTAAYKFLQNVIEGTKTEYNRFQIQAAIELVGREPVRPEPSS